MKYFICATELIQLGIPAGQTKQVIPSSRIQAAVYETENEEAFISVPALLKLNDRAAPHGIVLKTEKPARTVLLVPRIENELEIPEENIHSLPEALAEMFKYFRGACFNGQDLVLLLDPEKITAEKFAEGKDDQYAYC